MPVKTVKDIVNDSQSNQLSAIKLKVGPQLIQALLTKAIFDELKSGFKVKSTLTDSDIVELVNRILNDYWHLKLEDIKACFYNAKWGRYEQNYNKLEIPIVMRWIEQYDIERQQQIIEFRQQEASQHKVKDMTQATLPLTQLKDEYLNQLKETIKKVEAKKLPYTPRERTKDEVFIQRHAQALALFNEIKAKQKSKDDMIEQHGKRINFNLFVLTLK